jgi:hypothetical protein
MSTELQKEQDRLVRILAEVAEALPTLTRAQVADFIRGVEEEALPLLGVSVEESRRNSWSVLEEGPYDEEAFVRRYINAEVD